MKDDEAELFDEWWSKEQVSAPEPTLTAVRFAAWNGWLARSKAARLALLGIDRMLESVRDELKNIESGNHATIACLMSEGKGLTAAKMLLEGALRGHHGDHASEPQLHAGMLICQECGTDRVDPRSVCPKGADYRCPMIAKA